MSRVRANESVTQVPQAMRPRSQTRPGREAQDGVIAIATFN